MVAGVAAAYWLVDHGIVWFVDPSKQEFPIRGLDVSHHQGSIDWSKVASSNFDFVYAKATEGATWRDPRFAANWAGAKAVGLDSGAYHFFTSCASGKDQAENFLRALPREPRMLAPAVDLEFGGNCRREPTEGEIERELTAFVRTVEFELGQSVVFYVTQEFVERYPNLELDPHRVWIRSLYSAPRGKYRDTWLIWQYHCRARVAGIDGPVDLDVARRPLVPSASKRTRSFAPRSGDE